MTIQNWPKVLDSKGYKMSKNQKLNEMRQVTICVKKENTDVFFDLLSSEYVNDVIYNRPERLQHIRPILNDMNFIREVHIVLSVVVDNFWEICEFKNNAYRYSLKRILLNQTRNILSTLYPSAIAATLIGTDKVVVLINCGDRKEKEAEKYAYSLAEQLKTKIIEKTKVSVSIGVSNYCASMESVWLAYEQSFLALNNSFASGNGKVLKYETYQYSQNAMKSDDVSVIVKQFVEAMSSRDPVFCMGCVNNMFQHLSGIFADENYIKSYVAFVLSEIVQYCTRLGMDADYLSKSLIQLITSMLRTGTISHLHQEISEYLMKIFDRLDADVSPSLRPIHMAHAYIEQFHSDNICLKDMAEMSGYSEAYFSRLFKKTYHETYVTFLKKCRIEHAKRLLNDGKQNIEEIAEAVGFKSACYFNVCFRELTGQTPSEFRSARNYLTITTNELYAGTLYK